MSGTFTKKSPHDVEKDETLLKSYRSQGVGGRGEGEWTRRRWGSFVPPGKP